MSGERSGPSRLPPPTAGGAGDGPSRAGGLFGEGGGPPARERVRTARGQVAVQETVGHVQVPLAWMVTPQVLPLPLGRATSTWLLG
ncbi:hypothetical protein GCM10010421_53850 [Streptomyces glaucus]|uniref:Secreted protein n=1 Tax=Streptomyces glaucus TaxID=284029 RepID=A0ABN3KB18_9ACTN